MKKSYMLIGGGVVAVLAYFLVMNKIKKNKVANLVDDAITSDSDTTKAIPDLATLPIV